MSAASNSQHFVDQRLGDIEFLQRASQVAGHSIDPAEVARFLDRHGVYVWNGHSYALPVIEWLGLADLGGVVRIGPTHYNTVAEVDTAVELVREFVESHG